MKNVAMISSILFLVACSGGENDSGKDSFVVPDNFVIPDHYFSSSYAPFSTTHTADNNLEGAWLVFMNGSLIYQDLIGVTGSNFREEQQLYSRYLVRLKKRPDRTDGYYIYSCGPMAARDDAVTQSASTIEIPFYVGACCSTRYQMSIVDPVTIQGRGLTGSHTYISGQKLSWDLSFTLKRISDDAMHPIAQLHDNAATSTVESGCVFEADGTYNQTQNDSRRQNFQAAGRYYSAYAYPTSALNNNVSSYSPLVGISQDIGNRIEVQQGSTFYSTDQSGTSITLSRSSDGKANGVSVRVLQQTSSDPKVDVSLDVNP